MPFELDKAQVTLVHKNDRIESHGEEKKLACDLNFTWETSNAALALFAPDLRSMLYTKEQSPQQEIPETADPDHLTALRFPGLAPLKWGVGELEKASLTFHVGTTGKGDLDLNEVKMHRFRIEAKQGGTVVIGFQIQCRPTDQQAGKLSKFLQDGACQVSVAPADEGNADAE